MISPAYRKERAAIRALRRRADARVMSLPVIEPLTVYAVLQDGFVKIAAVGRFAIPEGPLEQELSGIADQIRTVASWRNRESA